MMIPGVRWAALRHALCKASPRAFTTQHCFAEQAQRLAKGIGPASLELRTSSVPNSGIGVHISAQSAAASAGVAIALYAGVFLPMVPMEVRFSLREGEPLVDVAHLTELWGGSVLDKRLRGRSFKEISSYWLILEENSGIMDGWDAEMRVGTNAGPPLAVGQYINHPPAGVRPNVRWLEVQWHPDDEPIAANRVHHGVWYVDPVSQDFVSLGDGAGEVTYSRRVPGVAIVTLREIAPGEELFMDYKLSRPHPSWYAPVPKYHGGTVE